ncbi:hypothetical protein COO60DRAFT_340383 [Scenedesmus sp. NREL 46B-D3]|nr:hypothetical protein COO60DRAFT_340383 [Scenedesmus sp. NREL 46B-D3]
MLTEARLATLAPSLHKSAADVCTTHAASSIKCTGCLFLACLCKGSRFWVEVVDSPGGCFVHYHVALARVLELYVITQSCRKQQAAGCACVKQTRRSASLVAGAVIIRLGRLQGPAWVVIEQQIKSLWYGKFCSKLDNVFYELVNCCCAC